MVARGSLAVGLPLFAATFVCAIAAGTCLADPPPNDECADATSITGKGVFEFDNTEATTDGVADPSCAQYGPGEIVADVWFCWTAPCTGTATVDTSGLAPPWSMKLAAYRACSCPEEDANALLTCDECDYEAQIAFDVVAGESYLLRVGHSALRPAGGPGQFAVTCTPAGPTCEHAAANCQGSRGWGGVSSNSVNWAAADDFVPLHDGLVTDLCWWGAYRLIGSSDQFEVRYFDDAGGVPSDLIAGPFRQSDGTLLVSGPRAAGLLSCQTLEMEYAATHTPVAVQAGACYWIELRNDPPGTEWWWSVSASGNGRRARRYPTSPYRYGPADDDLAWCLSLEVSDSTVCIPPPPPNDNCKYFIEIAGEGVFPFDNREATTDSTTRYWCGFNGTDIAHDAWFCWTAPHDAEVSVDTCGQTAVDTLIEVYESCDLCPPPQDLLISCDDDMCGLQSSVAFYATGGQRYLIALGTYDAAPGGTGTFRIRLRPPNDNCAHAIGPAGVSKRPDPHRHGAKQPHRPVVGQPRPRRRRRRALRDARAGAEPAPDRAMGPRTAAEP